MYTIAQAISSYEEIDINLRAIVFIVLHNSQIFRYWFLTWANCTLWTRYTFRLSCRWLVLSLGTLHTAGGALIWLERVNRAWYTVGCATCGAVCSSRAEDALSPSHRYLIFTRQAGITLRMTCRGRYCAGWALFTGLLTRVSVIEPKLARDTRNQSGSSSTWVSSRWTWRAGTSALLWIISCCTWVTWYTSGLWLVLTRMTK